MLERLRRETRDLHERLDHHPLMTSLMSPEVSLPDYARVLSRFFGFYQSLEPSLQSRITTVSKLPWLAADLEFLRIDICGIRRAPEPHWIVDEASALGTYYVMEGSTLGGQVISRHISKTLDLTASKGLAYFNSYGSDVGRQWQATRELLTRFASSGGEEDAVIAGARSTFSALALWLDV